MTMKWKVHSALAGIAMMIAAMCAPLAFGNKVEASCGPSCGRGYGRCYASGCYCRRFEGSGYTCYNCGHNYSRH